MFEKLEGACDRWRNRGSRSQAAKNSTHRKVVSAMRRNEMAHVEHLLHLLGSIYLSSDSIIYQLVFGKESLLNDGENVLRLFEKYFGMQRRKISCIFNFLNFILGLFVWVDVLTFIVDLNVLDGWLRNCDICVHHSCFFDFLGGHNNFWRDFFLIIFHFIFLAETLWYKVQPTFIIRIDRSLARDQLSDLYTRMKILPVARPVVTLTLSAHLADLGFVSFRHS